MKLTFTGECDPQLEKLVKVTMVIEDPMTVSELLEEFSNFLAGCGFAKYKFEIVEDDDNG